MKTYTQTVEAVRFDGSSTHAHAIQEWVEGGEYCQPSVSTRDMRSFMINRDEYLVNPGDYVIRDSVGSFFSWRAEPFEARFKGAT